MNAGLSSSQQNLFSSRESVNQEGPRESVGLFLCRSDGKSFVLVSSSRVRLGPSRPDCFHSSCSYRIPYLFSNPSVFWDVRHGDSWTGIAKPMKNNDTRAAAVWNLSCTFRL